MLRLAPTLLLAAAVLAAPAAKGPIVDLGYARYQGGTNTFPGFNSWFGIKFAAPPTGNLRWRAPQPPLFVAGVQDATVHAPTCPQSTIGGSLIPVPLGGSEDCLTLDLFAPSSATPFSNFPVVVFIHGGGFDLGDATNAEPPAFLDFANKNIVYVTINYRLGVWGFLAGKQLQEDGTSNAGTLDQAFALQWVQEHIRTFGGNPQDVTIWGESAGGTAMMQLMIAEDGRLNPPLFQKVIASSPALVLQFNFDDSVPQGFFDQVVESVGCTNSRSVTACLRNASFEALQTANVDVTAAQPFGAFAFEPVVDGVFIRSRPTIALERGQINGEVLVVTNNANDGLIFTDPTITPANFSAYINGTFHGLAPQSLVNEIEALYPLDEFPSQLFRSSAFLQELIFACPSYLMASSMVNIGRPAFRGFWDVGTALHGADVAYDFAANVSALQSFTNFQNWDSFTTSTALFNNPNTGRTNPATNPPFPLWSPEERLEKHFNLTVDNVSAVTIQKANPTTFNRCLFFQQHAAQLFQ